MNAIDRILESAQDHALRAAGAFAFLAAATLTIAVATAVAGRRDVRRRAGTGVDEPALGRRSARHGSIQATKRLLDHVSRHFVPTDPQELARLRRKLQQAGFLAPSAAAWFFAARVGLALALSIAVFLAAPEF